MYQVYKITNLKDGKVYIGSSIDVPRRWRQHKQASLNENDHHYNYPLMKAFREDGVDNFSFEIVSTLEDYKTMIETEHNFIIQEDCIYPKGYNQTDNTESPMFDPKVAQKMSDTKREKYGKKVCEINDNNEIISVWNSIVEVSEATKLDRYKISDVCNGRRHTTGDRVFRFLNEQNEIIVPELKVNQTSSNRITKTSRQVAQFDKNNGEFIQVFPSLALAAKEIKGDSSSISKVCRGKMKSYKGYIWKYIDENDGGNKD